ncbi:hypothetical protein ACVWZ3_006046 [Bradyrhizobium sp. i1.3.6]
MAEILKVAVDAEDYGGLLSDRIRNALTDEIASGVRSSPVRPWKSSSLPIVLELPARRCGRRFASSWSAASSRCAAAAASSLRG